MPPWLQFVLTLATGGALAKALDWLGLRQRGQNNRDTDATKLRTELFAYIARQDERIAKLEKDDAAKDARIQTLEKDVAARDARIAALESLVAERVTENETLKKRCKALEDEVATLRGQLHLPKP